MEVGLTWRHLDAAPEQSLRLGKIAAVADQKRQKVKGRDLLRVGGQYSPTRAFGKVRAACSALTIGFSKSICDSDSRIGIRCDGHARRITCGPRTSRNCDGIALATSV